MSANTRKALYGLIPAVIALLTVYGVLTNSLAVLWGNVLTLAVGLAFAASRATGNRFLDPEVRRGLYVLAPAAVALVGGYVSLDLGLWTSLVLAILGAALAGLNVDPDEQAGADTGLDILDGDQSAKFTGNTTRKPKRSLRLGLPSGLTTSFAAAAGSLRATRQTFA